MKNEQMEIAVQSVLSAYADIILPKLQKAQSALQMLPESMEKLVVKLDSVCVSGLSAGTSITYSSPLFSLSGESQVFVDDDCALSILAEELNLNVNEGLLSGINDDLSEILSFNASESAPGEGTSLIITKDIIKMNLVISLFGNVYRKMVLID